MKIIQFIYSLSSGGGEKFVVDLSNQLARLGHDVIICILRNEYEEKNVFNRKFVNDGVKFHSLDIEPGFSYGKMKIVENYIIQNSPDVVHCHLNVIPYIFRLALINRKIKFFHTLHSLAEKTCGNGVQKYINYLYYKKEWIYPICISKLCQRSYIEFYHLKNAPYINNGRSLPQKSTEFNVVVDEINTYKYTQSTIVFTHVARFHEAKNQKLLIESFNKLDTEGIDFVLLVIGIGFDSDEGLKLQDSACKRIKFLGIKSNVADYLMNSDAFCLSSSYEGMPLSLLEAISCGVTPICTPVGGITDIITDGVNGYLSEGLNVETYVRALKRYLASPIPADILVSYFKEHLSIEKCANLYEDLYKRKE